MPNLTDYWLAFTRESSSELKAHTRNETRDMSETNRLVEYQTFVINRQTSYIGQLQHENSTLKSEILALRDQIQKMHEQQEYTRLQQSRLYTAEQVQLLIDENYSQAHNQGVTKAINCMERIYGSPTTLDINHNADLTLKYEFKHE